VVLVILDENVPHAIGPVFGGRGHEVVNASDVLTRGTPDDVIAKLADVHAAVIITWNRRDFRRLSALVPVDNVRRFRSLSWIAFHCRESRGAERVRRWLAAIEFHLQLASQRRDSRLMIDITDTTFTVLG
jgi:hypothetical protein